MGGMDVWFPQYLPISLAELVLLPLNAATKSYRHLEWSSISKELNLQIEKKIFLGLEAFKSFLWFEMCSSFNQSQESYPVCHTVIVWKMRAVFCGLFCWILISDLIFETHFNSTTFPAGACIVQVQFKLWRYLLMWVGDWMSARSSVIKPPHDCTSYFNRKPFFKVMKSSELLRLISVASAKLAWFKKTKNNDLQGNCCILWIDIKKD